MMDLSIYDVSPMVFIGSSNPVERFGYPTGGIQFLLNRLAVDFARDDGVVLCFDSPSKKSYANTSYKAGREPRPAVISQIETLYNGLSACGIRCYKVPGYEADDIVDWAVTAGVQAELCPITVFSNDKDICHSIQNGVRLQVPSRDGIIYSQSNFEQSIYPNVRLVYNTISAYKVFCGCSSDNIKPFKGKKESEFLYGTYCDFIVKKFGSAGNRKVGPNPDLLRVFVQHSGLFSEEEKHDLNSRISLIFPASKPESVSIKPVYWKDVDKRTFAWFASKFGCYDVCNCLGLQYSRMPEAQVQELRQKGRALKTGAYAADNDLVHATSFPRSVDIDLDAITKDY